MMVMHKDEIVPMEDTIEALIAELVQPLLSKKMIPDPPIAQQKAVAKQMHAVTLLYNYYHRKECRELEFLPFESLCKTATIANQPLLGFLGKTASRSENLSLVEESISHACNISMALFDNDAIPIETWPIEKVAVFLADVKREKCFLEKDTLVEGVFSLVEIEVEGQKDENVLEQFALSKIESRTGISQASLSTWYSCQTYSLSKEKSRTTVFLVECSKLPAEDKGFAEIPISYVLNNLKGPVVTSDPKSVTPVVGFFLLLPYADIISDWLSKSTSKLMKEREKRSGKQAKSNIKSSTKIDNMQVQVKKEPSNGSSKRKDMNGNDNPDKQRDHPTSTVVPSKNHTEQITSLSGSSNNYSLNNVTSNAQISSNGSQKPVKLGEDGANNRWENDAVKKITKDVKQEIGNTSKELVNSKLHTPTKRPVIETSTRQEIVPLVMKNFPYCLRRMNKIRDNLCENQRKLEDKIAQCEMDILTIICEGHMTPEVEKILDMWESVVSCEHKLDSLVACSSSNKKKKFKFRSACQQLDDNCRDNNLPLPRYNMHPISDGLYVAVATLKSRDMDCTAKSDLKNNPHDAREHAAWCLMQKLSEIDED